MFVSENWKIFSVEIERSKRFSRRLHNLLLTKISNFVGRAKTSICRKKYRKLSIEKRKIRRKILNLVASGANFSVCGVKVSFDFVSTSVCEFSSPAVSLADKYSLSSAVSLIWNEEKANDRLISSIFLFDSFHWRKISHFVSFDLD